MFHTPVHKFQFTDTELPPVEYIGPRPLTEKEFYSAARVMENSGGSFAGHLAAAWFAADSGNKARIESAFEHLFRKFVPAA